MHKNLFPTLDVTAKVLNKKRVRLFLSSSITKRKFKPLVKMCSQCAWNLSATIIFFLSYFRPGPFFQFKVPMNISHGPTPEVF